MSTKTGYLTRKGTDDVLAPKTLSSLVKDEARNQALSASLVNLIERNALGYPSFSTVENYNEEDVVFNDRKLWIFLEDKSTGLWDATKVREFSIKEYIDAINSKLESDYARNDGWYSKLVAGSAENLVGQTVDSEAYLIRPTGGAENDVANGVSSVLGLEGNSCVWNQLVNGAFADLTYWAATGITISVNNNVLTFVKDTSDIGFLAADVAIITGHKYYYSAIINEPDNFVLGIGFSGTGNANYGRVVPDIHNSLQRISNVYTGDSSYKFTIRANNASVGTALCSDVVLIDLTLLGIDNLTTVSQVEAWLAEHIGTKPYYAYNEGEILSAQTLGIKTYGQNLLNPTTRQAKLIPYTWEENSNVYTIKNVPSGATATFTPDKTGVTETVDVSGGSLDITSYGSGVLELSAATADTYVCMKWDEQKDDDVVPYEDHTYDFDVRKVYGKVNGAGEYVQCFPNGMRSVGTAKDSLTAAGATKVIGDVDMGTLNDWYYQSYGSGDVKNHFRTRLNSAKKTVNVISCICPKYQSVPNQSYGSSIGNIYGDKKVAFTPDSNGFVVITDSAYTDAAILKASLNGVSLYYELATPITYTDLIYRDNGVDTPLADVLMNITVNNWSMEEQLTTPYDNGNPTSIPATIKTQYGMDAVEAIDTLQNTCYFADDVKANLQALLNCINTNCAETLGGTFSVTDTATDKVFEFTFTPNTEPDVESTNEGE